MIKYRKISSSILFASAKKGSQLSSHRFILSLKTTGWQGGLQLLWQCIVWSSIFAPDIFAQNILKLVWCGGRECDGREQGWGSQLFSHLPAGHQAVYNAHMLLNLNFVHFLKVFVSKFVSNGSSVEESGLFGRIFKH